MKDSGRQSILMVISAFLIWGLAPLYFKQIHGPGALEVMAHRVLWAFIFLSSWVIWSGRLGKLLELFSNKKIVGNLLLCALLIACNWLLYVYAVFDQRILEISFSNFINPLVNVFLGMIFLRERLSRSQTVALLLTLIAVLIQIPHVETFPYLALGMALSFGFYSLIRKRLNVDSVLGCAIEDLFLLPFVFIILLSLNRLVIFSGYDAALCLLLAGLGLVTAIPLVLFTAGVIEVPLSLAGFLQYITPICQFFIAIAIFFEPISALTLVSFGLTWAALLVLAFFG